ncbi:serine protease 27-like [Brachionus plicatilis]|uniref:Serine protease 27-like n=1 Tax=Brachionus plicatilis TaxID=10195 RepID=A0A3M7P733_BRAPC|nr:serine protease 27-like [Brachionus plicatilis]
MNIQNQIGSETSKPSLNNENYVSVYPALPQPVKFTAFNSAKVSPTAQNTLKIETGKKNFKILFSILISLLLIAFIIITGTLIIIFKFLPRDTEKSYIESCRYGREDGRCIECGMVFSSNKVIGGQNAQLNSWPSVVYIIFKYNFNKAGLAYTASSFCGGTLINQDTVITAAHCYSTKFELNDGSYLIVSPNSYHATYESMYTIYLGLHNKTDLSSAVSRSVKSFTIHPNYDEINLHNDIAVIKLSSKVVLNDRIQVACLPHESEKYYPQSYNVNAYVVGWGINSITNLTSPDILQEALVTVYDSSKCRFVSIGTPKNWQSQICAGKYEGGIDTCQGDSGGPLFVKDIVDNKQKFILAGVTSYGEGCAEARKPGIYTRVSAYEDWITEKMNV